MKTTLEKPQTVNRKWWLVDADGQVLGRMATRIARILMGKHKPTYTPHVDCGDHVIVVNASKIKVTGKKMTDKVYRSYSGYPGGLKEMTFERMLQKHPADVIRLAVRRMLPKNRLAKKMITKLKVYKGPEHRHQAQKPEKIDLTRMR